MVSKKQLLFRLLSRLTSRPTISWKAASYVSPRANLSVLPGSVSTLRTTTVVPAGYTSMLLGRGDSTPTPLPPSPSLPSSCTCCCCSSSSSSCAAVAAALVPLAFLLVPLAGEAPTAGAPLVLVLLTLTPAGHNAIHLRGTFQLIGTLGPPDQGSNDITW